MTNMTITHPTPSTSLGKTSSIRPGRVRTMIALGAIGAAAIGTGVAIAVSTSDARSVAPASSSVPTPDAGAAEQFSDVERGRSGVAGDPGAEAPGVVERGLGPKPH